MDGIRPPWGRPVMVISGSCQESTPLTQERGKKMRRKRFQKGSLQARKHGRHRVWVAAWWEDGSRRSKVLGCCSQMSKAEAESVLSGMLRDINSGVTQMAKPVYTVEQFINGVYLPFGRRSWKESTAGTSEQIVKSHLIPEFGKQLLHAIRREELQDFLDRKALALSSSPVSHLRWFLNAIFKLAASDGLMPNNPAAELKIPRKCQPGRAMRPLAEEEVNTYLEVFDLREKLIVRLAIFEGMRPGEILALRWKSVAGEIIRVEERVYKRVFNTPKNGKTREGAISDGTLELLNEWAGLAQDPSPDGFVFPSEKIITPLSLDNLWRRYMYPKLVDIGLEWATFQVLRKTNASLSKKAGVDPKVASDQRGHGIGVSLEVYTTSDMEQKRAALKKLEAAVLRKPQPERRSA
ncbi:MAG: tyrosine-type recombinase/integrase [Candidatus Solibacter sp.]